MNRRTLLGLGFALVLLPPFNPALREGCDSCEPGPSDPDDPDGPVRDENKGERLSDPRAIMPGIKDQRPREPGDGPSKKGVGDPMTPSPAGHGSKQPGPVRPARVLNKVPRPQGDPEPLPTYAELRVRLTADGTPLVERGTLLQGHHLMGEVVRGDLVWEVAAAGVPFLVGTSGDPRVQRTERDNGVHFQGFRPDLPAYLKVIVPPEVLGPRHCDNAVVRVYELPGALKLKRLTVAGMQQIRPQLRPLGATRQGELCRALAGNE